MIQSSKQRSFSLVRSSAWVLLALVAAAPAVADWLVMVDGSRVETKGTWDVKGRQVVFTQPNGTLSAVRATEVDLEASHEVTELANRPPAPPVVNEQEPPPEPVLVLTNKDIPKAVDPGGVFDLKPEVVPQASQREPVQVISWRSTERADSGIEIRGTVRNTGSTLAANINIRAEVKDEEGQVLGFGNAFLGTASLTSGRSTNFRIPLPDVYDFVGDPDFTVSSSELTVGGAPRSTASGSGGDDVEDEQDLVGEEEGELVYLPLGKPSPEFVAGGDASREESSEEEPDSDSDIRP